MKLFLTTLLPLVLATSCFAAEAQNKNQVISKEDSRIVVSYLIDICWDTFCGGDFIYDFKSMNCSWAVDGDSCELNFTMTTTDYIQTASNNVEASFKTSTDAACTISQIKSRKEVVEYKAEHNDKFVYMVTNCLGILEHKLSKRK